MRRRSFLASLIAQSGWIGSARALSPMQQAALLAPPSGPSLDLNFLTGSGNAIDPRISFTRASGASYFDATGTLQTAASNVPRIDYGVSPGGVTNWLKTSTNAGAVAGVLGSGGSLPTNWAVSAVNGIATNIVGFGTDTSLGISLPYVDLQFSGTSTATFYVIRFDTNIPNPVTQPWIFSTYTKLVAGSLTNITSVQIQAGGGTSGTFTATPNTSGTLVRSSTTGTLVGPVTPQLNLIFATGATINVTLRLAGFQFETGSVANNFIPTTTVPVNQGATPLGLLIEEARTNSIRNPRCEGASAGTPGTMPTNCSVVSGLPAGITASVIGTGSESGIPYLDLSFSGTPGSSGQIYFSNDAVTPGASSVWTQSAYLRLIAGTLANVTLLGMQTTGSPSSTIVRTTLIPTSLALSSQRATGTITVGASDTALVSYFQFFVTSGQAISFTIRIGAPSLELGAFATSVILPTIGTPAATTRAADVPVQPTSSWFNPAAGTIVVEANMPNLQPAFQAELFQLDDGTSANRIYIAEAIGTTALALSSQVAGAGSINVSPSPNPTLGTSFKVGGTWNASGASTAINGGAVTSGSNVLGVPPGINKLGIGNRSDGLRAINGYLRRLRYWPRALSNNELQKATT